MTGLWIAAGLFGTAAFGFVCFHLGVRATLSDWDDSLNRLRVRWEDDE